MFHVEDKNAMVDYCLVILEEGVVQAWNLRIVCAFQDWKLELADSFLELFYSNLPSYRAAVDKRSLVRKIYHCA